MKLKTTRFILSVLCLFGIGQLHASDLIEVLPLTNQIIMLRFDDGYVRHHEIGEERSHEWFIEHRPLDVEAAELLTTYSITSADDGNYSSAVTPIDFSRKTKGTDYLWMCENYDNGCINESDDHVKEHWIYLYLPTAMQNGKTYTINTGDLALNGEEFTLYYHDNSSRSEAVHVNNIGYDPAAWSKFGYVYHWLGSKGQGLDLSSYDGAPFQLINQATGAADFTGTLTFRKAEDNQETFYTADTPNGNHLGAEVYECNFSGFGGTGTYVLSVDGIGCSFPFELNSNVYDDVFYWTMKGLYQNRSGIALEAPYTDHPRDAPHNVNITPDFAGKLVYSTTRHYDVSSSDNATVDKPLWEAGILGEINTWGWYQDAGDWDTYGEHARVPANLMFLYEIVPSNFSDGELNIPESGNGVPDLIDEARWQVAYYHRTRHAIMDAGYGTGGVGGARTMGDLWGSDEKDGKGIGSWLDTHRQYVVSGEEAHISYIYAGLAAQRAWILSEGGFTALDSVDWEQEAIDAYTWAGNNTLEGDSVVKFSGNSDLVANRMYAATALYRLTGDTVYHEQFLSDVTYKGWTESTTFEKEQQYAAWIYARMTNETKDSTVNATIVASLLNTADFYMTHNTDKRACRWAGNYYYPILVGQSSTPMINEGVMGQVIANQYGETDKANAYKYFTSSTCDYFLGTNPLNMTWITGFGERSPQGVFHMDSWYNGTGETRKGIIPYGAWKDDNSLGPLGPWNHKWANKTITPTQIGNWPAHERWFDQRHSPLSCEFTIHQNNGVAAMVYGFLKNGPGTAPAGNQILDAPTNFKVTTVSDVELHISWNDSTEAEGGFEIERKNSDGSYSLVVKTPANSFGYTDKNLTPETTYTYRVRTFNTAGYSAYSVIDSATTLEEIVVPATEYEAENYSETDATSGSDNGRGYMDYGNYVQWNKVSIGVQDTISLIFTYANGSGSSRQCDVIVNDVTVGTVAFNSLATWQEWGTDTLENVVLTPEYSKVRLQVSSGFAGPNLDKMVIFDPNDPLLFDKLGPDAPSGLEVSGVTYSSFSLKWNTPFDSTGTVGYEVMLNDSIYETSDTTMMFSGLSAATSYKVAVRAKDGVPNWSVYSDTILVGTKSSTSLEGGYYHKQDATDDGVIAIEAEHYTYREEGTGSSAGFFFEVYEDTAYSNGKYVMVPGVNKVVTGALTGPALHYDVEFIEEGTYSIYVQHLSPNSGDNSCLTAYNGSLVWDGNFSPDDGSQGLALFRTTTTINATVGLQRISIYLREDGTPVDKIVISKSTSYGYKTVTPDGASPEGYEVQFNHKSIHPKNAENVSFEIQNAEVGAVYNYSMTSTGGGDTLVGSGIVGSTTELVSGIDVSSFPKGLLVLKLRLEDDRTNIGLLAKDTIALRVPDTEWTSGGWSAGAPEQTKDIRITDDANMSGDITCRDLMIKEGHTLNIPAGVVVTVKGDFINNGNGVSGGGTLRFEATGDTLEIEEPIVTNGVLEVAEGTHLRTNGQLVLENGATLLHKNGDDIEGAVQTSRNGNAEALAYNFWSIPVQDGTQVDSVGGANRYIYDEPSSSWLVAPDSLYVGQGVIATGAGTVNVTGIPFSDSVFVPVTYQGVNPTYKGFNLVGNPYLAALDYDAFVGDNAHILNGTLHLYVGNADGSGAYTVVNSTAKADISSFQAFFIQVEEDSSIAFLHEHKTDVNNNGFMRSSEAQFTKLPFVLSSGIYTDEISLVVGEAFSNQMDYGYDAVKMFGDQSAAISIKAERPQSIIALQTNESYSVDLDITFDQQLGAKFDLLDRSLLEKYDVVLVDRGTGKSWNLRTGAIDLTGINTANAQFVLEVFDRQAVLSNDGAIDNSLEVLVTSESYSLHNLENAPTQISVTDITGRVLFERSIKKSTKTVKGGWDLKKNNVYIITITNGSYSEVKKVFLR